MANTLNLFRGGAVGFIDWLDVVVLGATAVMFASNDVADLIEQFRFVWT